MTRIIRGALAAACFALPLAACNTSDKQTVLNGLQTACAGLQAGTSVVIQVSGALPNGASVAAGAATVQAVGGVACAGLIPTVNALVNSITSAGATATVTATTTNPVTKLRTVRTAKVMPTGQVIFTGTVPPNGFPF